MEPDPDFTRHCVELHRKHSPAVIANVLGAPPVEVSRALRHARAATEVQPWEIAFIAEKTGAVPDRVIIAFLGMTPSQFDQIRRRHGIRQRPVTLASCIAGTRWLVENWLGLAVDDRLPRLISGEDFTSNGLYPLIEFATREKAKDELARHFSACALLISLAYPGRFKLWQFTHAKTNTYFTGPGGKRNFLDALLWLIHEKLEISREALPFVLRSASFLNRLCLEEYGLGAHWWRRHWLDKQAMLEDVARHAGVRPAGQGALTTAEARVRLAADGVDPTRCAVSGCRLTDEEGKVEVHHVVRRATRNAPRRFDVHAAANLIPLCRHHHGVCDRFRAREFDLRAPATLRAQLLAKLARLNDISSTESDGDTCRRITHRISAEVRAEA